MPRTVFANADRTVDKTQIKHPQCRTYLIRLDRLQLHFDVLFLQCSAHWCNLVGWREASVLCAIWCDAIWDIRVMTINNREWWTFSDDYCHGIACMWGGIGWTSAFVVMNLKICLIKRGLIKHSCTYLICILNQKCYLSVSIFMLDNT